MGEEKISRRFKALSTIKFGDVVPEELRRSFLARMKALEHGLAVS